ncbi:type 2 lantibiotic biosynthesis protein LanM [Kitasatospora sp. MAP12-15]|uniref:type 2 lanthipeptide synthetase LanM family protein n=1 Tax=unclassified Kitasatospora TaxID=2633591 RepID=UPI00247608C5|nr:type 2 lanthipeptide synthetase LanM family protein [Kitasatospora sp. MAP12-44]MDH6110517.1 type 2 lantibiotic biosynthesis protein LanM [Kitasatospora sp. MAP12-44]
MSARPIGGILSTMNYAGAATSDREQELPWWIQGVTLTERLGQPPADLPAGDRRADRRLERWRADFAAVDGLFEARLAEAGLVEDGLRALLDEEPAALAARIEAPDWARAADRVLAAAPTRVPAPTPHQSWDQGFAAILAPFTEEAADRLLAAARGAGAERFADLAAIRACFTRRLAQALVRLARRTLVLELNVMRVTGRLAGETSEERFADFVRQSSERSGLTALLTEYAVLARLLAQSCQDAVDAWAELLTRLGADRGSVAQLLGAGGGGDPGRLTVVDPGAGDSHQRGRAVALLGFESGARLVYKPRPLDVHQHFNDTVRWLNARLPELGLRTLAVLERPGYGWVEFVTAGPCGQLAEVDRFYHRLGALLALLHTLGGTDIHFENLVACADQPVLVDLETLFHPALALPGRLVGDPALRALDSSVYRISLLPHLLIGDRGSWDVSALGGDKGAPLPVDAVGWAAPATDEMLLVRRPAVFSGSDNRPRLGGQDADPAAHTESLLAGFRAGYDTITTHRAELTGPDGLLSRFTTDRTRVVARNTQLYAMLLDESTHPDVLRDALDRDRLLDLLWRESAGDPARWPLVPAELDELWAGDIPLLAGHPAARTPSIGGRPVEAAYAENGLDRVHRRLGEMGRTDRYDQEWIIRAALATRTTDAGHRTGTPLPGRRETVVPDPDHLLAAACGIADQILAGAHDDRRRANWLTLEAVEEQHWAILPQGAGLAGGYCGTALFLAQLADLTGTERYAAVARRALRPVPEVLAMLAAHPEPLAAVGCGGFEGLGGIAYALSHLSVLLADRELADWAAEAVRLTGLALSAEQVTGEQPDAGVLTGLAGCLAAMLAVHRATGLAQAADAAARCARQLVARSAEEPAAGGFADGAAGIGWALLRFAAAGGGASYAEAGLRRLSRPSTRRPLNDLTADTSWCRGLTGTALALADSGAAAADPALADRLAWAVARVAGQGPLPNHSLCHGELGSLELLLTASGGVLAGPAVARAGALLASLDRFGPRCGTPGGVSNPGLLNGLAGIGHGLLRLGFGSRIPSVLLLQPPNASRS